MKRPISIKSLSGASFSAPVPLAVALDAADQPLELAHEAAAVGKVDQRILVREPVEHGHAFLEARDVVAQAIDLRHQRFGIGDVD